MDVVEPDRYAQVRGRLRAATGTAVRREVIWAAVGIAGLLYGGASSWSSRAQIATLKLDAAKCEPLVLDQTGHRLNAVPMGAVEASQKDLMVISRIADTVKRLRGLDSNIKVVAWNWSAETPLFETDEASRKLSDYRHAAGLDNVERTLARQQQETVEATPLAWGQSQPKTAPNRYWMRWIETHRRYNGVVSASEYWSGEFDTTLKQPDNSSGDWNPVRYSNFEWHRDLVQ